MRISIMVVIALALAGCNDEGPWDGPYGLKSGLTEDQLGKIVTLTEKEDHDSFYAMHSGSTPDYRIEDGNIYYGFNENGVLCGVSLSEEYSGETSDIFDYFVYRYGKPDKKNSIEYIYPGNTEGLEDGISHISISVIRSMPSVNGRLDANIFFDNYVDCM